MWDDIARDAVSSSEARTGAPGKELRQVTPTPVATKNPASTPPKTPTKIIAAPRQPTPTKTASARCSFLAGVRQRFAGGEAAEHKPKIAAGSAETEQVSIDLAEELEEALASLKKNGKKKRAPKQCHDVQALDGEEDLPGCGGQGVGRRGRGGCGRGGDSGGPAGQRGRGQGRGRVGRGGSEAEAQEKGDRGRGRAGGRGGRGRGRGGRGGREGAAQEEGEAKSSRRGRGGGRGAGRGSGEGGQGHTGATPKSLRNHMDSFCRESVQKNIVGSPSKQEAKKAARKEWLRSETRSALVANMSLPVAKRRKFIQ